MNELLTNIGKPTSIWLDTTPETDYPELAADLEVDIAIVGGGIAGLLTAYYLQKSSHKVAILEADRIVKGTTGFTTAKITSGHGLKYQTLVKKLGQGKAQIYALANQQAVEGWAALVEELKIDCDFVRQPAYSYAAGKDWTDIVKKEVEAAKSLGLPVGFVERAPVSFKNYGAIKYENQAQFHPRKFLLALSKIMIDRGGLIFENSAVGEVLENQKRLVTKNGSIKAKKIIIATNYPIFDPADIFKELKAHQSYTLGVTIGGKMAEGMFIGFEEKNFHSFRSQAWRKGKEILLVGGEAVLDDDLLSTDEHYARLAKWAREHFDIKSIEYHWTTSDSETPDEVPVIGRLIPESDDFFVVTGFVGWGMTHSWVAAQILNSEILGRPHPWSRLYSAERIKKHD